MTTEQQQTLHQQKDDQQTWNGIIEESFEEPSSKLRQ
jgi:hypothetical protein